MWYFDEVKLLLVHHRLIKNFGGSHGLRDIERIKFVVNAPKLVVFEQEQYPTLFVKAAVYIHNIIADHPFTDGNKRTGISAGLIFLQKNGASLIMQTGELEDFAVRVATEHLDIQSIASWLEQHCQKKLTR